jgi:hypothetical protein
MKATKIQRQKDQDQVTKVVIFYDVRIYQIKIITFIWSYINKNYFKFFIICCKS